MLEQFLELVKHYGQEEVVNNPDIPNDQNNAVMASATENIVGTLQAALANGQVGDVMNLFNSQSSSQIMSNPLAQQMQNGFLDNISQKLGINKNVAIGLAATFLPIIISKLVKRTRSTSPEDGQFDITGLISQLTGGNNQGIAALIPTLISQFTGGGQQQVQQPQPQQDGGLNIGDLITQITSGAKQQQQTGGIGSLINTFFGK